MSAVQGDSQTLAAENPDDHLEIERSALLRPDIHITETQRDILRRLVSNNDSGTEFYLTRNSDGWWVSRSGERSFDVRFNDIDELRTKRLIGLERNTRKLLSRLANATRNNTHRRLSSGQKETPAASADGGPAELPELPEAYIELARVEATKALQRARGQLDFMNQAVIRLVDCTPAEKEGLEAERDWRQKNARRHLEDATSGLFDSIAEQCWNVVRPDEKSFSKLLPLISAEVAKVIVCPELDQIISQTLSDRSARWAERTAREAAVDDSVQWANLGGEFAALADREAKAFPNVTNDQLLHAHGNYTIGLGNVGTWTLVGSSESIRVDFERQAARAGIALKSPSSTSPVDFWLHRLFVDLLENRSKNLFCAHKGSGGMIKNLLQASVTYCARLERIALENEGRRENTATLEAAKKPEGAIPFQGHKHSAPDQSQSPITWQFSGWDEVEIRFLSDERVQITAGQHTESRNYAEFGFEDGRSKTPNLAWVALRSLAEAGGIIRRPNDGQDWTSVEKRMQEIRRIFRNHFKLFDDPLPFIEGTGYQARFKIGCGPSFNS